MMQFHDEGLSEQTTAFVVLSELSQSWGCHPFPSLSVVGTKPPDFVSDF